MPYRTASLDTSLVDAWNEQRKDILSLTLSSHILPMLEAEVKREMARKAQEAVVAAAADALREVVNTGVCVFAITFLPMPHFSSHRLFSTLFGSDLHTGSSPHPFPSVSPPSLPPSGTYMPQYRNINCTLIPPFEDFQLR